jgi:hypothetical protein
VSLNLKKQAAQKAGCSKSLAAFQGDAAKKQAGQKAGWPKSLAAFQGDAAKKHAG